MLHDWSDVFLKYILPTGIITAVFTQSLIWWREAWLSGKKKKSNAGYLAIRAAVSLEAFVESCADVVSEIDEYESSGGFAGKAIQELPDAPVYPDDDECWKAIDSKLLEKILSFPNSLRASQKHIHNEFYHGGDPVDLARVCLEQACATGIEAWELAVDLRKKYRFPEHSPAYDYVAFLRKRADEEMEVRKKERERDGNL